MLPHQIQELSRLEPWHFWFVARRRLLRALLVRHLGAEPQALLEIGCGSGELLRELAERGVRVVGIDQCPEGLSQQQRSILGGRLARADAAALPLRDDTFDAALLFDILEHVDDVRVLREVRRVLRPGACVFLSAPAFPSLWGVRDELAGHRRRYTREGLRSLIEGAGLELVEVRFFQSLLFPVFALARHLGRRSTKMRSMENAPPAWLNRVLLGIHELEEALPAGLRPPFGSSLIAVCRAPGANP